MVHRWCLALAAAVRCCDGFFAPPPPDGESGGSPGLHPIFKIFPAEGNPGPHAIYEAEVVQLLGSGDAEALKVSLPAGWAPLRLQSEPSRALLIVGLGDFRNTSAGAYRELALALPACELSSIESEDTLLLPCQSPIDCQNVQPDCAHTHMMLSYVDRAEVVPLLRGTGVDVRLAHGISSGKRPSSADPGRYEELAFRVQGPSGAEVVSVVVGVPRIGDKTPQAPPVQGRIYQMQPFLGAAHVFGPVPARYVGVFPEDLAAMPAMLGEEHLGLGAELQTFCFKASTAMFFPTFRALMLPPWNIGGARATAGNTPLLPNPGPLTHGRTTPKPGAAGGGAKQGAAAFPWHLADL